MITLYPMLNSNGYETSGRHYLLLRNGKQRAINGPGMMSQLANTMQQMWALHILVGLFAIGTGLFVTGKPLAQMAMLSSASVLVIVGGGMGYMTGHHGYDGTPPTIWMILPLIALLTTLAMGVGGYLSYKDLTSGE